MKKGAFNTVKRGFVHVQFRLWGHMPAVRLTVSAIGLILTLNARINDIGARIGLSNDSMTELNRFEKPSVAWALIALSAIFAGQLIWAAFQIIFGRREPMPPPPLDKEVRFVAHPASETASTGSLTALAEEEFSGDTMRRAVVQDAIRSGCAVGLRIQDSYPRDVGFLDFYHLKAPVLERWIAGNVFERDLTIDDFEPIATAAARGDREVSLFVGALLLETGNPVYDFHLAPLVVSATRQYLVEQLAAFANVHIFASIFSRSGRRYAELEGMTMDRPAAERGPAGGGHDVYVSSFQPGRVQPRYAAVSRQNAYVLQVER